MLKLLRYIFYRGYKFGLSNGQKEPAALIVLVSLPILFNIWTLISSYEIVTKQMLLSNIPDIVVAIITVFPIVFSLYLYLGTEYRIKDIFKEFEETSNKTKYWFNTLAVIYYIISVVLLFYTGYIIKTKDYLNW